MAEQQQQRSESVELDDSNSNQSCATSRSSSRHSSVDIETNVDESVLNVNPAAVMSVADSLSPVKPIETSSPPPSSSTSAATINNKLTLNHHASHLYTIEAILGLNKGSLLTLFYFLNIL